MMPDMKATRVVLLIVFLVIIGCLFIRRAKSETAAEQARRQTVEAQLAAALAENAQLKASLATLEKDSIEKKDLEAKNHDLQVQIDALKAENANLQDLLKNAPATPPRRVAVPGEQTGEIEKPPPVLSIAGEEMIHNNKGEGILLGDQEAALLDTRALSATATFPADKAPAPVVAAETVVAGTKVEELKAMQAALNAISATHAKQTALATVKPDGTFSFTDVKDGKYALFEALEIRNAIALWLIPVEVKGGEASTVSLSNKNAALLWVWDR
jgi:competence protein ComGC